MRTIDLAVKYAGEGVVGVDLSGAPNRGDWDTYEEALEKRDETDCRRASLRKFEARRTKSVECWSLSPIDWDTASSPCATTSCTKSYSSLTYS